MHPAAYVGNDVVDLTESRTEGRATDERFVDRVFAPEEREAIADSGFSDLELWSRWAAKETGFKIASKLLGEPPPFVHRAFVVEWVDEGPENIIRRGTVRYQGLSAHVTVALLEGAIHCFGFGASGEDPVSTRLEPRVERLDAPGSVWLGSLEELEGRFSEAELDAVHSRPSAAVRLGARTHLADRLGIAEERIEIVCDPGPPTRRPPRVFVDGCCAPTDVSLSHDGRWIAWVIG